MYQIIGGSGTVYFEGTFEEMLHIYDDPGCQIPLPQGDEPLTMVLVQGPA